MRACHDEAWKLRRGKEEEEERGERGERGKTRKEREERSFNLIDRSNIGILHFITVKGKNHLFSLLPLLLLFLFLLGLALSLHTNP
jgi:hypothetical protein